MHRNTLRTHLRVEKLEDRLTPASSLTNSALHVEALRPKDGPTLALSAHAQQTDSPSSRVVGQAGSGWRFAGPQPEPPRASVALQHVLEHPAIVVLRPEGGFGGRDNAHPIWGNRPQLGFSRHVVDTVFSRHASQKADEVGDFRGGRVSIELLVRPALSTTKQDGLPRSGGSTNIDPFTL
jgi:hypothetical protein